jgi:serine/threonine protein kinase/WD40 repeat protein
MKPLPPKSTRVHRSTGQSRPIGEHVIRADESEAPTVVPVESSAGDSEPATDAAGQASDATLHFGDHPPVYAQSPAIWLGALGYRIDRLIGRGGYGEVYLADHPKLPRQVAIKVPRADVLLTAEFTRRFLDEANIVAQMDHPNVVTIYDMISDPYPAIIYEYCGDGTLQNLQHADDELLDEATAIKLFELVADALAFAHNRGILHRDIKPSNILIQAAANQGDAHSFFMNERWWTPKLADFGLAKVYGDGHTETASGMVAGTPEYMSPEQAIGRSRDVGTFSDTFSLGVLIYRTLIGQVPFPATSRMSSILKIENGDYAIPRRVRPELSVDIEAVIVKSLRAAPSDRYRDATELRGDLRRLLKGQPVEARPYTWRDRVAQTARRNPVASVSVMFMLLGFLMIFTMNWRTSTQQKAVIAKLEFANSKLAASIIRSELSERAEVQQRVLAEKLRYAAEMRLCQESFIKGDIRGYHLLLQNHVPKEGQQDHRGFSWYWLWEQGHAEPYKIDLLPSAAYCVTFSPDEKWLAACGADGAVRVYATSDWSMRRIFYTNQGEVNGLHFSRDGASIVSAGDDGTAKLWDWQHGRLITSIKCHDEIAYSAKFIKHDTQLVTCGNERPIRIWDLGTSNSLVAELVAHTDSVDSFQITEDEKYIVSAGADGARVVWDLESFEPVSIKDPLRSQRVLDVAVVSSENQVRFLSASLAGNSGENALLMLETSNSDYRRALLSSSSGFQTICTTNQGNLVAVGDRDGGVTLLDISDMLLDTSSPDTVASIIGRWTGHKDRVYSSAFSPSGKHLVTCGMDGHIFRWEPSANQRAEFASMSEVEGATEDEQWTAFDYADQTQQVFVVSDAPAIDRWDVRAKEIKRILPA